MKIFFGDGRGDFEERTRESNLRGMLGGLNLNHADYDNDGDVDDILLLDVTPLSLGIEIRNCWEKEDENSLIRTLSDTNFRLQARHLVVVVPDDFSDETFELLREIEKRNVIENLSIIRVGDFGNYLEKIKEIEQT